MTIKNDDFIKVQNLTGSKVSYIVPESNMARHFEAQQLRDDITAGELRSLYATKGGRELLEQYLGIRNAELAKEFNISTDAFEHEYSWTQKEVDKVLTTGSLDELKDAVEFGPEGIKQLIVDRAIQLKIPDNNKLAAIYEFTGRDVANMIKLDIELGNQEKEPEIKSRRVTSNNSDTQQSQRRASK